MTKIFILCSVCLLEACMQQDIPEELFSPGKKSVETAGLPSDDNHDPSNIIFYNGNYYLWYTQHVITPEQPYDHFAHTRIDYITSPDGIHWEYKGIAVDKGGEGDLDEKGALTAYVVPHNDKFYMFYSAIPGYFSKDTVSKRGITVAMSDTPDGPWIKTGKKILWGSEDGRWDDHFNGDAHIIRYKNQWWFYFKGVGIGDKPDETQLGIAVSDNLLGPYLKHEANPLIHSHAFSVWKHGTGIALVAGKHSEQNVFYAPDGLHFKKSGPFPNKSTGFYYPDNFRDDGRNKGITWGVDVRENGVRELYRFECNFGNALQSNVYFDFVKNKALEVIKTGFSAGDHYEEVWIRDYNTFIELAARVHEPDVLKEKLMVFFRLQAEDGNIVDGYIPREKAGSVGYDFIYSDLEPWYAGHKNTVETDQESSLIQAIYKYVKVTGDESILSETVAGRTVAERLESALDYLVNHKYSDRYGLIYGATTADWGDVQPEHEWGVFITEDTHFAIDIYDNAMFLIALDNFMELVPGKKEKWESVRNRIAKNSRKHLWDKKNQKFIPHIYLNGSPFPDDFNENEIYYHGGTAVAIEAGLLSKKEIMISLEKMIANVKKAGAASIGLTMYPPYPEGYFKNPVMHPYGYQNGGDWTWFGARMIQQLIKNGMVEEAYEHIQPMVKRVKDNNGFYEWYTIHNEPRGSGTYRGSAGVLFKAVEMLEEKYSTVKQ